MATCKVDVSCLIGAIRKYGPAQTVQAHLQGLTKVEKAQVVVDLLNLHEGVGEVLGIIVSHLWDNYVVPEQLFDHYEGGKSRFMQDVNYNNFVRPTLEAAKASEICKRKHIARIEVAWGPGWEQKIDSHTDHPSVLSEHYLKKMGKLASNGMTLANAGGLLEAVVNTRIANPRQGVRSRRAIMASDIQKAIQAVDTVSKHYKLEPKECSVTQLTSFLDHGIPADTLVIAPETPPIPQNSTSPTGLPVPSRTQPSPVEAAISAQLGLTQTESLVTPTPCGTPPPRGLPTPDPSPHSKRSGPALGSEQAADGIEQAPASVSDHISSLEAGAPSGSTPACDSILSQASSSRPTTPSTDSVPSTPAPPPPSPGLSTTTTELHFTPINNDSPPARLLKATRRGKKSRHLFRVTGPARVRKPPAATTTTTEPQGAPINNISSPGRQLRSRGQNTDTVSTHPDSTPADQLMQDNRPPSNSRPPTPQPQPSPRKRAYSEHTSETCNFAQTYNFQLADTWADSSPVTASLLEQGFYKGLEVKQFANPRSHVAIHNQLRLFDRFAKVSEQLVPVHEFHTLLQQVLVQSPYVYLTALAAMKTTNHRLVSLPVQLITLPGSQNSKLMDTTFPFAQYVKSEKEVPGTRLLYSLNDATLCLGTGLSAKEKVQSWWTMSGGDLGVAADLLQSEHFSTVPLQAGGLIAMPPQLLWSAVADVPGSGSSFAKPTACKFAEVRYISLTPNRMLDFDYWPNGSYSEISRLNRDLQIPKVTGWGADLGGGGKRYRAAVEMRGVWGIGDAILGLASWNSALVQVQLRELFRAAPGEWYNPDFAAEIGSLFNEKLARMVETLELVHERAFGTRSS